MNLERHLNYLPLKALPRAGWVRKGVAAPESVAAHVWGVAVLVLELQPGLAPQIDLTKALTIALHHDTPEILAGDLTPHDKIEASEKSNREQAAAKKLLSSQEFDTWCEGEQGACPEAKFVKAMDRLDMALQALCYVKNDQLKLADAMEFIDYSKKSWEKLGYPQLCQEVDALIAVARKG